MRRVLITLASATVASATVASATYVGAAHAQAPVEATTATGDKVRLFPDGRWEYVDPAKRAAAPPAAAPAPAAPGAVNAQPGCPPGWQGGLFGFGRCIPPDDPQYNRGSLGRR